MAIFDFLVSLKLVYFCFIKISDVEHQLALINEFGFSHECIDGTARSTTGTIVNRLEFDDIVFRYPFASTTYYTEFELSINPYWRGFSTKGYYLHCYKLISFLSNTV